MDNMTPEDEALMDLSDEELEAAFKAAKADVGSDEADDNSQEDEVVDGEEVEDEIGDDLEQPEKDSDDNASSDDDVEDEVDDDSEKEDGEPDEELDSEEEQTDEAEDETETEEQPVQKHKFKANGREYEFTEEEMRTQFPKVFGQAMDYTRKMQAMKPHRKRLDALEQAKVSDEDVNLMIDVLKGDKGAINEMLKRTGVDALELDSEESKYVAKDYGRDESALAIKDVIEEISADKEYDTTHRILSKDWDDNSWSEVSKQPELIRLLHVDVKSGMYDKVQPIAEKLKVYGRGSKSDLEYYKEAAGIYYQETAQESAREQAKAVAKAQAETKKADKAKLDTVRSKQEKQKTVKDTADKRKAAAPTRKSAGTKPTTDFLDDSDEGFEKWYKDLQDKM